MRDGRPNPDIWGNIITCGEIAVGIYEIVGTKKRGLEVPKALAEEILPESVMEQAAQDGENLCFTDPVSNAIVADALLEQELVTDPQAAARLDTIRQLDDVAYRDFTDVNQFIGCRFWTALRQLVHKDSPFFEVGFKIT